jgi:anaerobic ribonucleoside-triphosphate reductase activating protein
MRIAGLKANDVVNCKSGITVSLWMQGCNKHCLGCHNPETWNFEGGYLIDTEELIHNIINLVKENGIVRNFSILGGEPLAPQNRNNTQYIIARVREVYPNIKIYLWTGYTLEELQEENSLILNDILSRVDVLVDGRYDETQRDITLPLRGSKNQRVLYRGIDF